jgi:hypothetical protein
MHRHIAFHGDDDAIPTRRRGTRPIAIKRGSLPRRRDFPGRLEPAYYPPMPNSRDEEREGPKDPVKETCRLIRLARSKWVAHNNLACRTERDRALAIYSTLTKEEKGKIPQELRVWLRYRSEKYFGPERTPPKRS